MAVTPPKFRGVKAGTHCPLPEHHRNKLGHIEQTASSKVVQADRLYNSLQALLCHGYASQVIRICLAH